MKDNTWLIVLAVVAVVAIVAVFGMVTMTGYAAKAGAGMGACAAFEANKCTGLIREPVIGGLFVDQIEPICIRVPCPIPGPIPGPVPLATTKQCCALGFACDIQNGNNPNTDRLQACMDRAVNSGQ